MIKLRFILVNGLVAALYTVLTIGLAPMSYGPVQVRLSEFMTLLAFVNKKYVPGLVTGCLLANLGSPFGITDMAVGTLATFLAVYPMQYCKNLFFASLLPVIANGIIIGLELYYLAALPANVSLWSTMAYVAAGEFLSVTVLGVVIMKVLLKNDKLRHYLEIELLE